MKSNLYVHYIYNEIIGSLGNQTIIIGSQRLMCTVLKTLSLQVDHVAPQLSVVCATLHPHALSIKRACPCSTLSTSIIIKGQQIIVGHLLLIFQLRFEIVFAKKMLRY